MTTKHKIKAVTPRLSDEDPDPIEQEDHEVYSTASTEGWLPWDADDIMDIRSLIETRMTHKQRCVLSAYLNGYNYHDIGVSEKYWRYHFAKGIEFIKKELKL
jgi:DNA-directed RNA polymerase specialized sigma24 family protein